MTSRALVVGLGQIGMGYDLELDPGHVYSHARAFAMHPAFELVGGVDPDPSRRALFQERFGVAAHADIEAAMRDGQPEVVAIALPTPLHGEAVHEVLRLGRPAAILCEKPLAETVEEARDMVRACAEAGVTLLVNYMRRADPAVREIRRRVDSGEIAGPFSAVTWYSKGLRHNGSHFVNLLEYWLGPMTAAGVFHAGRTLPDGDSEPDAWVTFTRGRAVLLAAREEAFSHYTVELLASNGRLRYERGGEAVEWQAAVRDPIFKGYTILSPEPEVIPTGMRRYQWHVADALAAVLAGEPGPLATGDEALVTLETINRITELR